MTTVTRGSIISTKLSDFDRKVKAQARLNERRAETAADNGFPEMVPVYTERAENLLDAPCTSIYIRVQFGAPSRTLTFRARRNHRFAEPWMTADRGRVQLDVDAFLKEWPTVDGWDSDPDHFFFDEVFGQGMGDHGSVYGEPVIDDRF